MTDSSRSSVPKGRGRGRTRAASSYPADEPDLPKPGLSISDDSTIDAANRVSVENVGSMQSVSVDKTSLIKRPPKTITGHLLAYMMALSEECIAEGPQASWHTNPVLEEFLLTKPRNFRQKRGESGKTVNCLTNYLPIKVEPNWSLCKYSVSFNPDIVSISIRLKLIHGVRERYRLENTLFDGFSIFSPIHLIEDPLIFTTADPLTGDNIEIKIKLEKQLQPDSPESICLLNVLTRKAFSLLKFCHFGRNFYNSGAPTLIDKYKLEIWPGFSSSVQNHDDGLLLCTEISHKFLRTDTVLDFLYDLFQATGGDHFFEKAANALIGATVMTRYNNRMYKIDDIMWKKKVIDCFTMPDGTKMSYSNYYKTRYNKNVTDTDQPLLMSRIHRKATSKNKAKSLDCFLVPEFCSLVGLSEELREDRRANQVLGEFTRIPPFRRIENARLYLDCFRKNESVMEMFKTWCITLTENVVQIPARVLPLEQLQCGTGLIEYATDVADWSRESRGSSVNEAKPMDDWIFLFTNADRESAQNFYKTLCKVGPPMGMEIREPNIIQLESDRVADYVSAIQYALNKFPRTRIVIVVVPNDNKTRYDSIKKLCCVESPIASQVVNSAKSLRNRKNLMTIVTKIAMQINVKMDGALWHVQIPMRSIMVIGYDCYHDSMNKSKQVGVCVFSMDENLTKWYSQCDFHEGPKEMVDNLESFLKNGLKKFHQRNGALPERVMFFRDTSYAEGSLPICYYHELPRIKEVFKSFSLDYKPKFTFCVVQKRINGRFFEINSSGEIDNPSPGTVVDSVITKPNRYDFYLVPQSVRQGTVTPVSYNVIFDESGLKPDYMQRFCYKLCHMYYNWQGTIRVPAACQYAHKLAMLVGQTLHRVPHNDLNDRLFFL